MVQHFGRLRIVDVKMQTNYEEKKNNNRERIIISSVGDERCLSYYWRSFLKLHNWLQVGIEACRLSDVNL